MYAGVSLYVDVSLWAVDFCEMDAFLYVDATLSVIVFLKVYFFY